MSSPLTTVVHNTDVCVVGGGIGGMFTAISAARHGAKVVLMQDRPVLGGNASSEIRMWIRGAGTRSAQSAGNGYPGGAAAGKHATAIPPRTITTLG